MEYLRSKCQAMESEEIDKEIERLQHLKEEWVFKDVNEVKIVDLISDLRHFRDNTHQEFPIVNRFYWNFGEYADVFFGDAQDCLIEYFETTSLSTFGRAMKHLEDGFTHLLTELEKMK